jgi:CheY-specific phosphatase CheX
MQVCDLSQLFTDSASDVLETMFFTCVLGETESEPEDPISARLDFKGDPSGSFGLSLSHAAALQIAAGFLALEESEIAQEQVSEVICELTNMLCGTLLSRLENESCFELQHPYLAPVPEEQGYSHNFELESGSLSVWLTLNETP